MTERKDIGRNGGKKRKVGLKINIDYLLATAYNRVQVIPFFHPYFLLLFLPNILSPSTRTAGLAHNSWFSSALPTGGGGATAILNYNVS